MDKEFNTAEPQLNPNGEITSLTMTQKDNMFRILPILGKQLKSVLITLLFIDIKNPFHCALGETHYCELYELCKGIR